MNDIIQLQNIVKVFPPNVVAVDNVSLSFREGEIHAIVGENGAGKSTLMKVLYALETKDSGEIYYKGQRVHYSEPRQAINAGIGMVHQEILLIQEYTVWENIVLGIEPTGWFDTLDKTEARRRVQVKIDEFQFNLNVDALVDEISVSARQKVEILKLLYRNVSILILDEPTAVLTPQEIPQLFAELRRLRDNGHTIIFISHRLDEVLTLADRITVMRKGKKIDTVDASSSTKEALAQKMVGREVVFVSRRTAHKRGDIVCHIQGLTVKDTEKRVKLNNINLAVHTGEIVGIAGVEGNGQLELVNTIMGLTPITQGSITIQEKDLSHAPIFERRKLISYVSQDRSKMGASLNASILENAIMTHHLLNPSLSKWNGLLLNYKAARRFTDELEKLFSVAMASKHNPIRSLSGGNQQKVILGRELLLNSPFVLLDQPTRGLDVGSIEYVHQQVLRIRFENRAVLLISAEIEELFLIADRLLVLFRGEIVADLAVESTSIEEIGSLMLQGKEK